MQQRSVKNTLLLLHYILLLLGILLVFGFPGYQLSERPHACARETGVYRRETSLSVPLSGWGQGVPPGQGHWAPHPRSPLLVTAHHLESNWLADRDIAH